jgi:molecular chaperone DnaK
VSEWTRVSPLLGEALSRFLGDVLPKLGGEQWWRNHVLRQLTPNQVQMVSQLPEGHLRGLDLAALLRVAMRNWSEIAFKQQLPRDLKRLLDELHDARHRHAHAPVDGVPADEHRRHVEAAIRLMTELRSDAVLLKVANEIISGNVPETGKSSQPAASINNGDSATAGTDATTQTKAVAAGWLVGNVKAAADVARTLEGKTFLGIDFGTSTTVVSTVSRGADGAIEANPLVLSQPGEHGDQLQHHLVNTVLANLDGKLIFGRTAYDKRQMLFEGKDVFSSFKMRLGVDIGPIYPATSLRRDSSDVVVETAQDAALQFFRCLKEPVLAALRQVGSPTDLRVAVTVPASFEANQRRDLLEALQGLDIPADRICMIDEPNAAFLSCLHESAVDPQFSRLSDRLKKGRMDVLVYDFGAGTCDISILEIQLENGALKSRNRAISRFTALGGDDLDRAIAKNTLLPQLLASAPDYEPTQREIDERLVPWLQPTAERLKIAAMKWATANRLRTLDGYDSEPPPFCENPIRPFRFENWTLSLEKPTLSFAQFATDLEPFFGVYDPDESRYHVFAPVADAVQKSGLEPQDLDAVLFIGGSAGNSLVQHAVMKMLPASVEAIVPKDLRTHVSLGAALHSFAYHGLSLDLIRPITSEPIMVVTKGGGLETIVPAGTEVPTANQYRATLVVDRNGQQVIELPLCVTNESKLLGLLRLESKAAHGFNLGTKVQLEAVITHDKMLAVTAAAAGVEVATHITNPMANSEITRADATMLEAKQAYNTELLQTRGRPSVEIVKRLASAARDAGNYDLAADMFITAQRLEPAIGWEPSICYAYSMAGKKKQAKDWAQKAYQRRQSSLTAYNLSVFSDGDEKLKYLREAATTQDPLPVAVLEYGKQLKKRGDREGVRLIERCLAGLQQRLDEGELTEQGCRLLEEAATIVGKRSLADHARAKRESLSETTLPYDEDNLAAGNGAVEGGAQ